MNDEPDAGLAQVRPARAIAGWEVVDGEGDKVATVVDLLVDAHGAIRFIQAAFGFPRRHVLLPSERLQWGEGRIILDDWTSERLSVLPPYDASVPLDGSLLAELARAYPAIYDPEAHEWREIPGERRIVPLKEARGFKLEKDSPDLRNWSVFGADGERVGVVSQLLVDPTAMKIRYADVDLLDDLFRLGDDRHVLVPLEEVDLRERGNDVWVKRLGAAEVARLPAYVGGAVSPAMERAVDKAFTPPIPAGDPA